MDDRSAARRWARGWLVGTCLLLGAPGALAANRALALNGDGGYVELPADVYVDVEIATVECWVRWETLQSADPYRIFNYGKRSQDISLGSLSDQSLWWVVAAPGQQFHHVTVPHLLSTDRWRHLAGVCGANGMKLYYDGILVGTNLYQGCFAELGEGGRFFLGRTVTEADPFVPFHGLIDELRVWNEERTPRQIHETMFARLTGSEPGLIGYWNFEDATASDAGPRRVHGVLRDGAEVVLADRPTAEEFQPPAILEGRVRLGDQAPGFSTLVLLRNGTDPVAAQIVPATGEFRFTVSGNFTATEVAAVSLSHFGVRRTESVPGGTRAVLPDILLQPIAKTGGTNLFVSEFEAAVADNPDLLAQLERLGPAVALKVFQQMSDPVPALLTFLESDDPSRRRTAAALLLQSRHSTIRTVEALSALIEDEDTVTRGLAVIGLRVLEVPVELAQVYAKKNLANAYLFSGLLFPFALIHFLLFVLFPARVSNLYYALFAIGAALLTYALGGGVSQPALLLVIVVVFLALSLRLLYALFYDRLPLVFWFFLVLALASVIGIGLTGNQIENLVPMNVGEPDATVNSISLSLLAVTLLGTIMYCILAPLEMLRVLAVSLLVGKRGAWLLVGGFLLLMGCAIMTPLLHGLLLSGYVSTDAFYRWIPFFPNAGIAAFVIFASLHLARDFSRTYQNLEKAKRQIERQSSQLLSAKEAAERARHAAETAAAETADRNRQLESATREIESKHAELSATNAQLASAKRAADAASEAKSQFLANMSHELRTPLNAIIGYSEMLQEDVEELGQTTLIPDLQRIHGAAKLQLDLINDILDLSKIEAGKMTLMLDDFDVAKLVGDVTTTIRPLMTKRSNHLRVSCPEEIGLMCGDQTKIRQVLFNLLSNASKFTDNGDITLRVTKEEEGRATEAQASSNDDLERLGIHRPAATGHRFVFQVEDTGIGISKEQMTELFASFTQADTSIHKRYGGTGLGLAITKRFCQIMGGSIAVTSEFGKGSTFTAILPSLVREDEQ